MPRPSPIITALNQIEPAPRTWREPGRPLTWFAAGVLAGAVFLPLGFGIAGVDLRPPPGFRAGIGLLFFYGLVLAGTGGIALTAFALGRSVRRNRRTPRFRPIPCAAYGLGGLLFPGLFLGLNLFTTWANHVAGLHWAVAIAGPFLLGLYTAPKGAARLASPADTGGDAP